MKKAFVWPALATVLSLAACGGSENKSATSGTEEATSTKEDAAVVLTVPGIENVALSNTWTVEGNDQMKFDTELIRVKAGELVTLLFKNVGQLPKESMGHNLVVLKPGTDVATFGSEAVSAADNDYIPKTSLSSIIVYTKLLGPGEEDTITFTLEKGVYPYLCSFPGHFGIMQGKIVAE